MESHELDFKYNLKSLLKRITGCVPVFLCTSSKKLRTEMKINKIKAIIEKDHRVCSCVPVYLLSVKNLNENY